jgi:hypothetical protein
MRERDDAHSKGTIIGKVIDVKHKHDARFSTTLKSSKRSQSRRNGALGYASHR